MSDAAVIRKLQAPSADGKKYPLNLYLLVAVTVLSNCATGSCTNSLDTSGGIQRQPPNHGGDRGGIDVETTKTMNEAAELTAKIQEKGT